MQVTSNPLWRRQTAVYERETRDDGGDAMSVYTRRVLGRRSKTVLVFASGITAMTCRLDSVRAACSSEWCLLGVKGILGKESMCNCGPKQGRAAVTQRCRPGPVQPVRCLYHDRLYHGLRFMLTSRSTWLDFIAATRLIWRAENAYLACMQSQDEHGVARSKRHVTPDSEKEDAKDECRQPGSNRRPLDPLESGY